MGRATEERGVAMVTALLVTMAVASLALVVVQLSAHNAAESSLDRKRVQAIDAAEAGVDATFSTFFTTVGAGLCGPFAADLPISPGAHYEATVQLYSTWPPETGSELACPPPEGVQPAGMRVTSKGTAIAPGSAVAVSRTMQSEGRLSPIYGDFGFAIFSHNQLDLQNKLTINGSSGNDANVYTNGSFAMQNNTTIAGSVFAQGSVTIRQGTVHADVWGNGPVELHNLTVFGNVLSSTSNILLEHTHVYGYAKASGTITLSNNSMIDGPRITGANLGPPPERSFPVVTFDQAAWEREGYVVQTYTDCVSAKTAIANGGAPGQRRVIRVTPAVPCTISFNSTTVPVRGDTAVVTDGGFSTANQVTFQGLGGAHSFYVIVPYRTGLVCSPGPHDVSISNLTILQSLSTFVYSPCTVTFGNNNSNGVNAQVIGGVVNITNHMVMNFHPFVVPGANQSGYGVEVAYLREIVGDVGGS